MSFFSQQNLIDWNNSSPADNILSQGWIMPLPSDFGVQSIMASAGFRGDQFISQFSQTGTSAEPKSNLCGSLTFRRRDMSIDIPETGTVGSRMLEYDYVFGNTALEPAIEIQAIVNTINGSQPVFQNVLTARTANYLYSPEGPDGPKFIRGGNNLSLLVNRSYLRALANRWKGQSRELKRRTKSGGYYGNDPQQSDSSTGQECTVVAGIQWANVTISAGSATWAGSPDNASSTSARKALLSWPGGIKARFATTTRKNSPTLIDTRPGGSKRSDGYELIYNKSQTDTILTDEIFDSIWLDDCGRFDANQAALDAIGWRAVSNDANFGSSDDASYIGRIRLISADGKSYRVTVRSGINPFQGTQSTHIVTIAAPAEFALTRADGGNYIITKIEVSDNGWKNVTGTVTAGGNPGPNVGLLEVKKSRKGSRLGFQGYPVDGILPNRYFMRQVFEHKAIAATE